VAGREYRPVYIGNDVVGAVWRKSYAGLAAFFVFSVFINVVEFTAPLYVLQVLDRVLSSKSGPTLVMLSIIAVLAILAGALLKIVRRLMMAHWGSWIYSGFGPYLFEIGLQRTGRTYSKAAEATSSRYLLNDLNAIRSFISGSSLIAWADLIWAPIFTAGVYLISPSIALIVVMCQVATIVLVVINERAVEPEEGREDIPDDRHWLASAEQNRDTVAPLGMSGNLADVWSKRTNERLAERRRVLTINVWFAEGMRFTTRMLRISIIGYGIWLVINDVMTVGAVIAAAYLGRMAYSLVDNAFSRLGELRYVMYAYARIRRVVRQEKSIAAPSLEGDLQASLILEDVSFRYAGEGASTFRNINVEVAPGEALYVIGPTAAGKTTFSRVATGLLKPRSGYVRLGDINVHSLIQARETCRVGYLPQSIHLFTGTIRENIARMNKGDFGLVVEAAKLAGIHDFILQFPDGYDTVISEDDPVLSAGRKKQIAIARAFYGWPSLIVLDEPEPHLDRSGRNSLNSAIRRLKAQGVILIVTTQSMTKARRFADKVILLEDARPNLITARDEIELLGRA
jgi:PrtD family type I secretion system ABC transporter